MMNRRKALTGLAATAGAVLAGGTAAGARPRRSPPLPCTAQRVNQAGEVLEELTGTVWTEQGRSRAAIVLDGHWGPLGLGDRITVSFEALDPAVTNGRL